MEILQISGDKPEFSNFIGDTMVLKEKSKVCLNKASFSIPVMVNRNLYLPMGIISGDYSFAFFAIAINGVENFITFQEFFDAYIAIDNINDPTIDQFYTGTYNIWLDNLPQLVRDGSGETDEIPTFTDIMVKACNTKFNYYDFYVENLLEISNLGAGAQDLEFILANTYTQAYELRNLKTYGITAMYEPRKVTTRAPVAVAWTAAYVDNFTPSGDGIVSVDANPAMAVSPNIFDRNGGYITATPQVGAGKLAMGLVFVGAGHDDPLNITGVYQPENFDVGIEFYIDTGVRTLRIIDGHEHFVFSHGGTIQEQDLPHYVPPNKIFTWDDNVDRFWFLVRGGRPMNGTQEFTTTIIQGPGPDIDDDFNRIIYVAKTTLNTSAIRVNTIAYSQGAGNGLDNWAYIAVTDDTKNEDDYLNNIILDNFDGIKTADTFSILPQSTAELNDWEGLREFWNSLGINYDENDSNILTTTLGNGYNKTLKWNPPKNMNKTYWVGADSLSQIAIVNNSYLDFNIAAQNRVTDIPREISFSLMDMTVNPRVGSFVTSTGFFDTGTINKVINYIQTDKDDLYIDETQTLDYVYEAFNLVYRKLENMQPVPITQLKAKLGFKNFRTNIEVIIPKINGVAKLELLFDSDK